MSLVLLKASEGEGRIRGFIYGNGTAFVGVVGVVLWDGTVGFVGEDRETRCVCLMDAKIDIVYFCGLNE